MVTARNQPGYSGVTTLLFSLASGAIAALLAVLLVRGSADTPPSPTAASGTEAIASAEGRIAELETSLAETRRELRAEKRKRRRDLKEARTRTESVATEAWDDGYAAGFDDGVERVTGGGALVTCPDGIGPGGGPCGWGE